MGTTTSIDFTPDETGSDAPQTPPQADPNRPDFLDPKFRTTEDQAKAYRDAQAELTRAKQELAKVKGGEPQSETPADPPKEEPKKPDDLQIKDEKKPDEQEDAAKKVADAAGVDLAPYQQEYTSTGDVSEENRVKIAESLKKVLGEGARQIVDEFIEARKVVHSNDTKMFLDAAGGQENYAQIVEWAKTSMPKEQIDAYNRQVESGDRHSVLFAIEGLKAKYEASNGKLPNRIRGNAQPVSNTGAYASVAEMTRDMRDPRYKTDEAFRKQVGQRIAASNL